MLAENPRGLDTLIESIQRCRTLNFMIVKITDEVQRVKNEKLEALKGKQFCHCFQFIVCVHAYALKLTEISPAERWF